MGKRSDRLMSGTSIYNIIIDQSRRDLSWCMNTMYFFDASSVYKGASLV
jgi:hypothetical protein